GNRKQHRIAGMEPQWNGKVSSPVPTVVDQSARSLVEGIDCGRRCARSQLPPVAPPPRFVICCDLVRREHLPVDGKSPNISVPLLVPVGRLTQQKNAVKIV